MNISEYTIQSSDKLHRVDYKRLNFNDLSVFYFKGVGFGVGLFIISLNQLSYIHK